MKLLVYVLVFACICTHVRAQIWSNRWFRRSSWFDNSWNTGMQPLNSWSTVPNDGWFNNNWNAQPVGWSDSWRTGTIPTGWTGTRDSWYQWYSWYSWNSWQGAPRGGLPFSRTALIQGTSPENSINNGPRRPNIPRQNRPETAPTQNNPETRPTLTIPTTRTRNQRGESGRQRSSYRNKRNIDNIPSIANVIDKFAREPTAPVDVCPSTYTPLCGNDNHTYSNACELIKAASTNACLDFAYEGECNSQKELTCFDCQEEDAQLDIITNMVSPDIEWLTYSMVVCGTDGNTYSSLCHLCKSKCLNHSEKLRPKHRGHCGAPFVFN
ncbi:uncharacterized protein [Antedon mediterranea]|uniref:uncharacterized protein n=1 Tax=Antedon mediterranea TaxID=105859 RepID=UPI003AF54280